LVDVIPDEISMEKIGIMFVAVARLIPDGTAMGTGMVVAEVGVAAKLIPDGTAVVAGTVVTEFTEATKVVLDRSPAMVIVAEVAVVSEVTKFSPDGESMVISVPASLAVLAPVSAVTLGIRISASGVVTQAFITAVSLSAWDPA
jgi:hypothetical protein